MNHNVKIHIFDSRLPFCRCHPHRNRRKICHFDINSTNSPFAITYVGTQSQNPYFWEPITILAAVIRTGIDKKNVIFSLYSIESSFKVTNFKPYFQKLFFLASVKQFGLIRTGIDPKKCYFHIICNRFYIWS